MKGWEGRMEQKLSWRKNVSGVRMSEQRMERKKSALKRGAKDERKKRREKRNRLMNKRERMVRGNSGTRDTKGKPNEIK